MIRKAFVVFMLGALALTGVIQAQDMGGMDESVWLWATTNAAGNETDSVVSVSTDLEGTLASIGGFEYASVESVAFDSAGNAYVTVDTEINAEGAVTAGGLVVIDALTENAMDMSAGAGSRVIAGPATTLIAPKGLIVLEDFGVVVVADQGAKAITAFALDAEGDVAPVQTIAISEGSVWDVWYDRNDDTLYAAGTTGILWAYDGFATAMGADGATRSIVPSDADGNKISINLHGIEVVADSIILSDVGDATINTDGQIFVINNLATADGATPVAARISGDQTLLGNPVDLAYDGDGIYVAEKANDFIGYYAGILSLEGDINAAADSSLALVKPESVAVIWPAMGEEMTEGEMMAPTQNIVEIAVANPDFSTLVSLVQAAGLVDVLADPNAEWTVFAPTNAAFEAVPQEVLDTLAANPALLTRVLTYHVVEGTVTSESLTTMMAPSMEMEAVGEPTTGSELTIEVDDMGGITVDGVPVVLADILATNGVIHVIESVLVPAEIAAMLAE